METKADDQPQVTNYRAFDMQICIPADWTDEQAKAFADSAYPCGTEFGWHIRTDAEGLKGDPERNPCLKRAGFVHMMLDM